MAHGLWLTTLQRGAGVNVLYAKTLALLEANPHHPSLRLHALSGKHAGVHSVSINLSYRITLELLITDKQITPINVGDYDAVY
jgi:plasmid maintenance system killer protein